MSDDLSPEQRRRIAALVKPNPGPWPEPLSGAAYHGLAGQFVRTIGPHSEADPAALLVQTLVAYGNVIGRGPGWRVEGDFHATNEFVVIVGDTAKARKGVSWGRVRQLFAQVEPEWLRDRVTDGLASGEGLLWQVRDPIAKRRKAKRGETADADGYVEVIEDAGVADKRLFVQEPEFSHALKVMAREGNTLSATLRAMWETGDRNGLTKHDPTRVRGAHVSVVAHITADELRTSLTETDRANGLANRFVFVCAQRARLLPFGGNLKPESLGLFVERFRDAVKHAGDVHTLAMTGPAARLWRAVYGDLSGGGHGMLGAITARSEAHTIRFAVLYALLDGVGAIDEPHLRAALELWRYAEDSAAHVFGAMLGHPLADRLLAAMIDADEDGISRTDLRQGVSHKTPTPELDAALGYLERRGLAVCERVTTGGRDRETWFSTGGIKPELGGLDRQASMQSPQTPLSPPSGELSSENGEDVLSPIWEPAQTEPGTHAPDLMSALDAELNKRAGGHTFDDKPAPRTPAEDDEHEDWRQR